MPNPAHLKRRSQVAIKIESVEGTAVALSADDVIGPIYDGTFTPEVARFTRMAARRTLTKLQSTIGRQVGKIAFGIDLAGSGDPDVQPSWATPLLCCGFGEDTTTSGSFLYTPDSSNPPSCTIALLQDGVIYKLRGARGNAKLDLKSQDGSAGRWSFEFSGVYVPVADASLFDGVVYDEVVPPTFKGVSLSLHGATNGIFSNFSFDLGNTLAARESASEDEAVLSYAISDRNVTGSIDPEMLLVSEFDYFGKLNAATTGALSFTVGASAGNTISFSAPAVEISNVKGGDRNGIVVAGCDLSFVGESVNTEDDEIAIEVS